MSGNVDKDLSLLEVGPLCHLRWLTLGCRLLQFYVSKKKPSSNLIILAEFCLKVYFPPWFLIKGRGTLIDGTRNLLFVVRAVSHFSNVEMKNIALKVQQNDAFFAHPQLVTLAMLGNEEDDIKNQAVGAVLKLRQQATQSSSDRRKMTEGTTQRHQRNKSVRKFGIPSINFNAQCYNELVNLNLSEEPPATKCLTENELFHIRSELHVFREPCQY